MKRRMTLTCNSTGSFKRRNYCAAIRGNWPNSRNTGKSGHSGFTMYGGASKTAWPKLHVSAMSTRHRGMNDFCCDSPLKGDGSGA